MVAVIDASMAPARKEDIDNHQYVLYPLNHGHHSISEEGACRRRKVCCVGEADLASPTLAPVQTDALAERLKALADPTRLRMLDLLAAAERAVVRL